MFKKLKKIYRLIKTYKFDFDNDIKYSTYLRGYFQDKESLLAHLAVAAHTIEKGLTMPEKKFNFGHDKVKMISKGIFYCAEHFDSKGDRFADIVGILKEYANWHDNNNEDITDPDTRKALESIKKDFPQINAVSQIYGETREHYFSECNSDFKNFAYSRHSCRSLTGKVSTEDLNNALNLAINTVPSTCNRQSIRVHVLSSKKILDIQKGNRGFGHLADKYLLLTSTLSHWPSGSQRNAPYVDGGIFLMNLLYSLHYYKIAAITLNLYLGVKDSERIHKEIGIPKNEVPIALVAIGTPQEKFDLARSTRRTFESIVMFHK